MIWTYLSHIANSNKFTGIIRTEYELAKYARELQDQFPIAFCRFDPKIGFIAEKAETVDQALSRFQKKADGTAHSIPLPYQNKFQKRIYKTQTSIRKRIRKLKRQLGLCSHPFNNGDTVITVGQELGSGDKLDLLCIKQKIHLKVQVLNHDIIPITYPHYVNINVEKFTHYMDNTIKAVDEFWCNSEFTKVELQKYIAGKGLPQPPMNVVTLGCDIYKQQTGHAISSAVNALLQDQYLLYVSTIEIRKNHQVLYHAYLKLLEMGIPNLPKIVFVGAQGWLVDDFLKTLSQDERVRDRIVILNKVSDDELVALYKNCMFTLYPSFTEGYGLPLAESLSLGKYCLSANTGSLPEVGGDFVEYCKPDDPQEWADRIAYLISHPDDLRAKEQYIQAHYQPASWESMAKKILNHALQT